LIDLLDLGTKEFNEEKKNSTLYGIIFADKIWKQLEVRDNMFRE